MKTLIYICAFSKKSIIEMTKLFLKSLFKYGNLNDTTNILVYTNSRFRNEFKEFDDIGKIFYEFNDLPIANGLQSVYRRFDIFNLNISKVYDRFLYTDIDVLIGGDINELIETCKFEDEIIYASSALQKDGKTYKLSDDWHGKFYFNKESDKSYETKLAPCSGLLLFNKCEKIINFFDNALNEEKLNSKYLTSDQDIICYFGWKLNCYDLSLQRFNNYVWDNNHISTKNIINHFLGTIGRDSKLDTMRLFIKRYKMYII